LAAAVTDHELGPERVNYTWSARHARVLRVAPGEIGLCRKVAQ
jgi:hypothetical protein